MTAKRREALAGYLFLAPNAAGFLVFSLIPIGMAFVLTFTEWGLVGPQRFVGIDNYTAALQDPLFWKAVRNTVYFSVGTVPIAVVIAFFLALLLNRAVRGLVVFRTAVFLPYVTLTVAIATVWMWIYNPDVGILNYLLSLVGIDGPNWLADATWAMPALVLMSNWRGIGYPTLIFLAALQTIPQDYFDAAKVDGANWFQRVRYVIVPMVSPATFFIFVTSFIGTMQAFDQFYIMTKGGPAFSTTTIVYYVYQNAFAFSKMGYASTLAFFLFCLIFVVTAMQWRMGRRWVHGEPAGGHAGARLARPRGQSGVQ
ncbi:sugar ABC transporter permease [Actinopolymorpha sp. B17G11]|uniref:carbohydrate ABC transporter permease n=1 Tax=Actinopolymorpha sp. B17G11 TaxID=3160861 RepID=UPI0032E435EF